MTKVVYNISVLLFVVGILVGGVACGAINEDLPTYEATSIVEVGDEAPDFTIALLDGRDVTLSELREESVLLIFFSHTCPDCKALFEDIKAARADIEAHGVRVVAISRGGEEAEVREYADTNGFWFDVAVDGDCAVYNLYATMYVPRAYMLDKRGVVVCATVEYASGHVAELLASVN